MADIFLKFIKKFKSSLSPCKSQSDNGTISRVAIDSSGAVAFLYNEYEDKFTGSLKNQVKQHSITSNLIFKCEIYEGRTENTQNLLRMVDIEDSLRISILSNMIQPGGIGSIINYHQSIKNNFRILYLYEETCKISCETDLKSLKQQSNLSSFNASTTHIVHEVIHGVHIACILELPSEQEKEIHWALENIKTQLVQRKLLPLSSQDLQAVRKSKSIIVYSNIPGLNGTIDFKTIFDHIYQARNAREKSPILKYNLTPIHLIDKNNRCTRVNQTIEPEITENLEHYLLERISELKVLKFNLERTLPEILQGRFNDQLQDIKINYSNMLKVHDAELNDIRIALTDLRHGRIPDTIKCKTETLDAPHAIKQRLDNIHQSIVGLESKIKLIKMLQDKYITYCDVSELDDNDPAHLQGIIKIVCDDDIKKAIFCSNDLLRQRFKDDWEHMCTDLTSKRKDDPSIQLIYADFTYSKLHLDKQKVLTSIKEYFTGYECNSKMSNVEKKRTASKASNESDDTFINILFLGESGVGKSTFINALANYLQFSILKDAENGEPIVVIPVSFIMTIGDNFYEEIIRFGDPDSNENHNNVGRSVTQQCRSYVCKISNGKMLRIIDTPGFGDTRGHDQDDLNMEIIFSYLNNFKYLNAVCLLLQPNVSKLNPYLVSCFRQLFDYFGEHLRHHIVFIFTNARSTFYRPGDTRTLLDSFLKSFSVKNIPLGHNNTFCFDNESFRYLVALKHPITFENIERHEFEKSWVQAVKESKRLETYLCNMTRPFERGVEWTSTREATIRIKSMVRPILEGVRNILRNILLNDNKSSIKLTATRIDQPAIVCQMGKASLENYGGFWIYIDHLRPLTDISNLNNVNFTEYRITYTYTGNSMIESVDKLHEQQRLLCEIAAKFAYFLRTTQENDNSLFSLGLDRMISEEKVISEKKCDSTLNSQLARDLEKFKIAYNGFMNEININLSEVYKLFSSLNDIPVVYEQISAIEDHRRHLIALNEKHIVEATLARF